ncbi:hypothetical protein [Desulfuromonas sp. AOP6]|uniref:hypothetical protein n=1 Tax=Desulfuromonas sp. AOP6 TaxID=1566351 RepID=UPI00128A0DCB|nr:hypothetical protein [Desulfuromonas sp. AOP6]BCA81006.1 hypothetical protein AOP6_2793 [Desulfuromonas sp. AOP6]
MGKEKINREALFALIWERPASEVAKDLGISDVALGKLCQRLQVPKPPRGYWAKLKAGRILKRPPLKAFKEESQREISTRHQKTTKAGETIKLSVLQLGFMKQALKEIRAGGAHPIACELRHDGIGSLESDLAAQILILIQNKYEDWLNNSDLNATLAGALQSLKGLVEKLLPLAKSQVLLFPPEKNGSLYGSVPTIIVRLSPLLQQRISHLVHLVREYKLSHVASELSDSEQAWSIRYASSPGEFANAKTLLCVSAHDVWLQGEVRQLWDSGPIRVETIRLPLQHLLPLKLLSKQDVHLPAALGREKLRPYADRLRNLKDAEDILGMFVSSFYDMEKSIPSDRLALLDRLWFGKDGKGAFFEARHAWRELEHYLEDWENSLEQEKSELCRDVIGIEKGDIVVLKWRGKTVRARINATSVIATEKEINFQLYGTRFRKDGTLGKRQETFTIHFENN